MSYPLPPYRSKPKPPPAMLPAPLALLSDEFEAKPFGSFGELAAAHAPQPTMVTGRPVIPPPPWVTDPDFRDLPREEAPKPNLPVGEYDPPDFGVPDNSFVPLTRFVPPEPDWRAEELERAEREERALDEEEPSRHPPPRRERA
jgi:hypothetical protein